MDPIKNLENVRRIYPQWYVLRVSGEDGLTSHDFYLLLTPKQDAGLVSRTYKEEETGSLRKLLESLLIHHFDNRRIYLARAEGGKNFEINHLEEGLTKTFKERNGLRIPSLTKGEYSLTIYPII